MTALPSALVAIARRCAERDTVTVGIEMLLGLDDCRGPSAVADQADQAAGARLAERERLVANVLFPSLSSRDSEALARVIEVVAFTEFGGEA